MIQSNHIVVFITAENNQEAHRIAQALISEKKAACVNIIPQVNSIFRWEGNIEETEERLLIVKTSAVLFSRVVDLVKRIHSYEVPEIIALPIIDGNPEYLSWIDEVAVRE